MFCQECGQKFSEQDNTCPKCGWYPEQKPDISKAQSSTSEEESFSSLDYDRSVKLSASIKRYELFSLFSFNLDHKGCIMYSAVGSIKSPFDAIKLGALR